MMCQCAGWADLTVDGKCLRCRKAEELRAENAKLRVALEFYAPMTGYSAGIEVDDLGEVARNALRTVHEGKGTPMTRTEKAKILKAVERVRAAIDPVSKSEIESEIDSLVANIQGACDLIERELGRQAFDDRKSDE